MEFVRTSLETCGTATGTVVVIDVLRAFSTAAYAFAAGAREIVLAGSVEEALTLKKQMPDALVMGEVGGLPVKEFDFGNSPVALSSANLAGRRLIQRTSAGTQGVLRSRQAEHLLASSLCCASATARAWFCGVSDNDDGGFFWEPADEYVGPIELDREYYPEEPEDFEPC